MVADDAFNGYPNLLRLENILKNIPAGYHLMPRALYKGKGLTSQQEITATLRVLICAINGRDRGLIVDHVPS